MIENPYDPTFDPMTVPQYQYMSPDHLGGHENKTHVDAGALKYMMDNFKAKSMIDVGCGPGGQVKLAEHAGMEAYGIDGDENLMIQNILEFDDLRFYLHDFTMGEAYIEWGKTFDFAWCCEFLEHVEEQYMDNYFVVFQKCLRVVCTHALPGQGGHHHVNCQEPDYWKAKFKSYGFEFNKKATEEIRQASTMEKPFLKRSGLVFDNKKVNHER
jgi:cyclopropane fatty-acyl-phospholipid synthase-like methyltransferase